MRSCADESDTVLKRAIVLIAATCSLIGIQAVAPAGVAAAGQTVYADASAKEKAVRAAMADPHATSTVLKAVRTVVADYERFVRNYPASGFSDDALWAAGKLSLDAFRKFGDPMERDTANRLLRSLQTGYPASSFARQAASLLASVEQGPGEAAAASPPELAGTAPNTASVPSVAEPAPAATPAVTSRPRSSSARIVTIKDIRRAALPDVVRIVIELDGEVAFNEDRVEDPARVFVDLVSTEQAAALIEKTQNGGRAGERLLRFEADTDVVRQVRIGRHANNVTRVVLDASGVSSYSVYPLYSPYRLVIDCIRAAGSRSTATPAGTDSAFATAKLPPVPHAVPVKEVEAAVPVRPEGLPAGTAGPAIPVPVATAPIETLPAETPPPPPPVAPAKNMAGGFSLARQLGLSVSRIVIDPGHGGHDPGAKVQGMTEAELVLDISLKLEKLLAQVPGVEVVLTRRSDEFVHLQERTAVANRENADLFLSIHANAHRNKQIGGVETYFLNFATSRTSEEVAARENASSVQAMGNAPTLIRAIALNAKLDESKDFAAIVQRTMVAKLRGGQKGIKDLGVKQAPFVVLIGAAMPSVLAEVAFLTNTQEGKLLKTGAYRQRIAEALFEAVRSYQTSLKKATTVAAKPR
jgi:N-acetylmuramoyl-L-alanine amidase